MSSPFVVVASPSYLKQHGEPTNPEALHDHACLIATSLTGSNDWIFRQGLENMVLKIPKTIEINDSDLLLHSAIKGAGVAYLPSFVAEQDVNEALFPKSGN